MWIYGLAMVAGLFIAYFSYRDNNLEATLAWLLSSGMAAGALGAHMEIKKLKEDDK